MGLQFRAGHEPRLSEGPLLGAQPGNATKRLGCCSPSPGCVRWQSPSLTCTVCSHYVSTLTVRTATSGSALLLSWPTRLPRWCHLLRCHQRDGQQRDMCAGRSKPQCWPEKAERESQNQSVGQWLAWRMRRHVEENWLTLGPWRHQDGCSRLSETTEVRGPRSPLQFFNYSTALCHGDCSPSCPLPAHRLRHSEPLVRLLCENCSH